MLLYLAFWSMLLHFASALVVIIRDEASGRTAYAPIFGFRAASLSTFCLRARSIILDQLSGRVAYSPISGLRTVSLCFYILPQAHSVSPWSITKTFMRTPTLCCVFFTSGRSLYF